MHDVKKVCSGWSGDKIINLFEISLDCLDGRTVNARASCAGGLKIKFQTAKSYTALQTVRYCFNIYASSCVALAQYCI